MSSRIIPYVLVLLSTCAMAIDQAAYALLAKGNLKCEGMPLNGTDVSIQVTYNGTGHRPLEITLPVFEEGKPPVLVETLSRNVTDDSGNYAVYASGYPDGYDVDESSLRMRITHRCYVIEELVGPYFLKYKQIPKEYAFSSRRFPSVFEFSANLLRADATENEFD